MDPGGDGKRIDVATSALVSGVTGQDGAYLAELLLSKGYDVHGIVRRSSSFNTGRIDHIRDRLTLHYGDLTDSSSLMHILGDVRPEEIYNLGAQSHVAVSFETPEYTADTGGLGVLRLLEAIRALKFKTRLYQASTSEMFGDSPPPQNEQTPFRPRSPYAAAKLYAYWTVCNYREAYGIHACNGILFNHESPIRGENFVTRKVCKAVARGEVPRLGNLWAVRDWGHARDYVEGMWLMLQHDPDDYVLATGVGHTVWDLVREACEYVGRQPEVEIDHTYMRPLEVPELIGDATKAREKLGWEPRTTFKQLVAEIMDSELAAAQSS